MSEQHARSSHVLEVIRDRSSSLDFDTDTDDDRSRPSSSTAFHVPPSSFRTTRKAKELQDGLKIAQLKFSNLGVHGRKKELELLNDALERICACQKEKTLSSPRETSSNELILVRGHSGTGKTALTLMLQKQVVQEHGGIFARGKFDFELRHQPYAGFVQTCTDICHQILQLRHTQPRSLVKIQDSLQTIFVDPSSGGGNDLFRTMSKLVPEIRDVIMVSEDQHLDTASTKLKATPRTRMKEDDNFAANKNRLHYAFSEFFRVLTARTSPLVIVLDDLQWADSGSLELLQVLMAKRNSTQPNESRALMVVGCYRSNEVNKAHLLLAAVREIRAATASRIKNGSQRSLTSQQSVNPSCPLVNITEISLGNLDLTAVNEILADLLDMDDPSETLGLAKICHRRTHGNAFFFISFVSMLKERGLLEFNLGLMKWNWNDKTIESKTVVTTNVVDLIEYKIQYQLETEVAKILQIAACLGTRFEERLVSLLWDELSVREFSGRCSTGRSTNELLLDAVNQSFLELKSEIGPGANTLPNDNTRNTTRVMYRWVHDKVQEAAISMIRPKEKLSKLKFESGEILMNKLDQEELEKHIFIVCDLLNVGRKPTGRSRRIRLAELNLLAARRAVQFSSFDTAANFASIGIDLLPKENCWEQNKQLSLDLYSTAAEMESIVGNVKQLEEYAKVVMEQGTCSRTEKVRVYLALIDNIGKRYSSEDALLLCFDVLKKLGCPLPSSNFRVLVATGIGMVGTQHAVERLESMMKDSANQIGEVDLATHQKIKLLDRCATLCFMSRRVRYMPLLTSKMLKLSTAHGISELSPVALVSFAILKALGMQDFKGGARYADMALELARRLPLMRIECRCLMLANALVFHWSRSLSSCLKPLLTCYELGLQTGDTETAMIAICHYCSSSFQVGKKLEDVAADLAIFTQQIRDLNNEEVSLQINIVYQLVLNLMGQSEHTTILTGEAMDEKEFLSSAIKFSPINLLFYQHFKTLAYVFFDDHRTGAKLAIERGDSMMTDMHGLALARQDPFYRAISCYAMAKKKPSYRREAIRLTRAVQRWARKGNPNVQNQTLFLNAEKAALDNKTRKAEELFRKAIVQASRGGILHEAALSNERYAKLLLHNGDENEGMFRIEEAIRLYSEWGATRKVESLRRAMNGHEKGL